MTDERLDVPEYRPYGGYFGYYPMPEPHKAGKDMSECRQTILKTALDMYRAKGEEADIYSEALSESWSLIRELRAQVDAQAEQIQALQEYADGQVERQTREYELERSLERRAS